MRDNATTKIVTQELNRLVAENAGLKEENEKLLGELAIIKEQRDTAVEKQADIETRLAHFKASAQSTWKQHRIEFEAQDMELVELRRQFQQLTEQKA